MSLYFNEAGSLIAHAFSIFVGRFDIAFSCYLTLLLIEILLRLITALRLKAVPDLHPISSEILCSLLVIATANLIGLAVNSPELRDRVLSFCILRTGYDILTLLRQDN